MGIKRELLNTASKVLIGALRLNNPSRVSSAFLEHIKPISNLKTKYGQLKINCPNELTWWRSETYFSKEPETLSWIDSLEADSVIYDIGANIGVYSLYSGKKGLNVFAFEPESLNFAELNKNIYLNKLENNVRAYNLALGDKNKLNELCLQSFNTGAALHNLETPTNHDKEEFIPAYKQGVLELSLDSLIRDFKMPAPEYIKIDVDGLEAQIINGASETLKNSKLKGILIELNENMQADLAIVNILENLGFELKEKADNGLHVKNYIFNRKS